MGEDAPERERLKKERRPPRKGDRVKIDGMMGREGKGHKEFSFCNTTDTGLRTNPINAGGSSL